MRFVLGINDDYISSSDSFDSILDAVERAVALQDDPDIWKVEIEARDDMTDDILLIMPAWDLSNDEIAREGRAMKQGGLV